MAFWSAFMLGLLGSLHCAGMCGPIAMALPLTAKDKLNVIFQSLLYQIGRVTTYGFMGLILGLMGWGITLSGYQKVFSIALGVMLIISALFSLSLERKFLNNQYVQPVYEKIKTKLSGLLSIGNNSSAYKIGMLNGFLPCGMVYLALAGAVVSGNALNGGLYMVIFGIGTIPMMMGLMIFGKIGRKYLVGFRKWLPYLIAIFGLYLIYRGMMLEVPADSELIDSGH